MDAAALLISIISALGTGAAAIIAWTSRADALRAEAEAAAASRRANDAWEATATALAEANARERQRDEAAMLADRKLLAAALRSWIVHEGIRRTTGDDTSPEMLAERTALTMRISATTHPNASVVDRATTMIIDKLEKGELALSAMQAADALIREWESDPFGFASLVDADELQRSVDASLSRANAIHEELIRRSSERAARE